MRRRLSTLFTACALVLGVAAPIVAAAPPASAISPPAIMAAAPAPEPGWNVVDRPIQPHTMTVTVALVAPRGTTPSFTTAAARQSAEATGRFLNRETNGAVTVQVDRVVDWMYVDNDTPCSWSGALLDWVQPRIGWERGPGKHLVIMVPPGDPCPGWANGEQGANIATGGRVFQTGTDSGLLVHELAHNMSMFHASSIKCGDGWDFSTLGAGVPATCVREEYGNQFDMMGGAYDFTPFPAPELDRIGMLSRRYEPSCGAVRTMNVTSVGAAAQGREAISFADPRDPNARYWVDFRARNDALVYNQFMGTPAGFVPSRDGLQITRNDPNLWEATTSLSRPNDGSDLRQLAAVNERVSLGGGAWVEYKGNTANGEAIVNAFVPCRAYETSLVAQHSNLCLDNIDWSSANGNVQAQYGCNNLAVQRYSFIAVPGVANTYTVVNRHSGKCLEVAGSSAADGAAVQQWTCTGGQNQQFTLRKATYAGSASGDYQLRARHSGKCVDVAGNSTAPGARTQQWTCNAVSSGVNKNQTWRITN